MDLRTVRRRAERRLQDLDLPRPFTTSALARSLAEQRGRPIHLLPKGPGGGPCGIWFSLDDSDYIFYDATTQGLHREHIVAHELAHVMWAHGSSDAVAPDVVAALLPDLDVRAVRRMLSRDSYSTVEEQEAEVLASLVLQQAEARSHDGGRPPTSPEVERLDMILGRREAGRG